MVLFLGGDTLIGCRLRGGKIKKRGFIERWRCVQFKKERRQKAEAVPKEIKIITLQTALLQAFCPRYF